MKKLTMTVSFILALTGLFSQNGVVTLDVNIPNEIRPVRAYVHTSDGEYWFGGTNGIAHVTSDETTIYTMDNSNIISNSIQSLWYDNEIIYIGTNNGACYYQNNMFISLRNNTEFTNDGILTIFAKDGSIYIGTNNGLARYINEEWEIFNIEQPVYSIESFNGSIYCGTAVGIYKLEENELIQNYDLGYIRAIKRWNNKVYLSDTDYGLYSFNENDLKKENGAGSSLIRMNILNNKLWGANQDFFMEIGYEQTWMYYINGNKIFPSQREISSVEFILNASTLCEFHKDEYTDEELVANTQNQKELDINNVRATYYAAGASHWNYFHANQSYEVPKDSGTNSLTYTRPEVVGKDENQELHMSNNYGYNLQPGPVRTDEPSQEQEIKEKFNRIWEIDRETIANFRYRFEQGEIQNGNWPISYDIATWPGNGDEGYADQLASYIDVNNDGVYNPMDGDYPEITGDRMLFWIQNDLKDSNAEYGMGLEIQYKAWAYVYPEAPNDSIDVINNTTFLEVDIINRSQHNYHDVFLALITYLDIGSAYDNYAGCDVMQNSFYGYNGYDEDVFYGSHPPAQSVTYLESPVWNYNPEQTVYSKLSKFLLHYGGNLNPTEFYNFVNGIWPNGDTITFGGWGADQDNLPADYMYPGDSDPYNIGTNGIQPEGYENSPWTEVEEWNEPFSRRGFGITGPFDFAANEKITFKFAFVYARDFEDGSEYPSVEKLREAIRIVNNWYDEGYFPTNYQIDTVPLAINQDIEAQTTMELFSLYPNPASNYVTVNLNSTPNKYNKPKFVVYDINGRAFTLGEFESKSKTIDLSRLPSGVYLLEVEMDNQKQTKQLIINK